MSKIEIGNIETKTNAERGWVVGDFPQLTGTPFRIEAFEMKWSKLKQNDQKNKPGKNDTSKTLTILIAGEMEIYFDEQTVSLKQEGDYAYWEGGISHTWKALKDSFVVTLRWPSLPKDQN